jgi:hypothetical protein
VESFLELGVVDDLVAVGSPLSAGAAQLTESRRVVPRLGHEVTAKAEHVRPLPDSTQAGPLEHTDRRHRHLHELLGTQRSRSCSGLAPRPMICSCDPLHEYFATYAATCPGSRASSSARRMIA